jgi:hypothetical protein
MRKRRPIEDRFWAKVDVSDPDGCWPWIGSRFSSGYGSLFSHIDPRTGNNRLVYAHRVSWELANGRKIPDGMSVLHSCDNPPCVRPDHLRVGTKADNAADREARGRWGPRTGERNPNRTLDEPQVRQIIVELQRLPRRSQASIAAQFGITQSQVSKIMLRQSWSHLWT